jgi:hypothetical protein
MFTYNVYSHLAQVNTQYQLLIVYAGRQLAPTEALTTTNRISQGQEITDDSQLHSLKRQLFNQINSTWQGRKTLPQDLVYKVAVATNGEIFAYRPLNQLARNQINKTPLPNLLSSPANSSSRNQTFANFRVVFRKSGVLEISPWQGFRKYPDVIGARITDPKMIRRLQRQLFKTLRENWEGKITAKQDLKYRVAVNKNGAVSDYEPINQAAYDYFRETPLPFIFNEIHGSNVAPPSNTEPQAHFRVVFKRDGSLDITQWQKLR